MCNIAAMSKLVGMEYPGLYSLSLQYQISFCRISSEATFHYKIRDWPNAFGITAIDFASDGFSGVILAKDLSVAN